MNNRTNCAKPYKDTVVSILHEKLRLKQYQQEDTCCNCSEWLISVPGVALIRLRNSDEFLRLHVTANEIWILTALYEQKENQSQQWVSSGKPATQKSKTVETAEKLIVTFICLFFLWGWGWGGGIM